jgi:hypothetical protein
MTTTDQPQPPNNRVAAFFDGTKQLASESIRRAYAYQELILRASADEYIDPHEIADAAAAIGRSPYRMVMDLQRAKAAYRAWQNCIDWTTN